MICESAESAELTASVESVESVDTHAHVFHRGLPRADRPRYVPDYDALPATYLALLDRHGIGGAVLVQPSFLGSRNDFLLDCLVRHPARFRAVIVLDHDRPCRPDALAPLALDGVAGIRLNLIGRRVPDLAGPHWRQVAALLAERGQHLEVHAAGEQWAAITPALRSWPSPVVIDHLGLPGASEGADRAVLDLATRDHVWIKASAPYRCAPDAPGRMLRRVLEEAGHQRLLWGSDWPWTRHEHSRTFAECLAWPAEHVDPSVLRAALTVNPARLLNWSPGRRAASGPQLSA
ncbi:amidohydrolase family protein [Kitasatospora sp. NPDC059817]|uniref:amidohydrolase family protein n=1 Tax=Kitasatospora sp. NPDC059817 TaxID=3346961 RepID=UPI003646F155